MPIEMLAEQVNSVVSEVTWTAAGGGIRPGRYRDLDLRLGQLTESDNAADPASGEP